MDTVELVKKARDEIQALIDGSSSKLSADVTGWILRDMRQSSDYNMPMQLAAPAYPDLQTALRDALAAFKNFGLLPDLKTTGGRLFVEKILSVSLRRLNGMLYELGVEDEGALYGYSKQLKAIQAARERLLIAQKASPQSDAWLNEIFEKAFGIKGAAAMIHAKSGELERKLTALGIQHKAMNAPRA